MLKDTQAFASFSVDDVDRAKQFYGGTLGLEVADAMGGLRLLLGGGGEVFVYPKDDHAPASHTVLNFPVSSIEDAVAKLAEAGIQFEQYPQLGTDERGIARFDGGPTGAWFKDPAGNTLGVFEGDM